MSDERRILLLEPDEGLREKIKEAFANKPCDFLELEESSEVYLKLAIEGPNFVIMTMELPDGDGIEVLEAIREFDEKLPVIVMMGEPTREKVIAAKKAKCADILIKPPDINRLAEKASNSLWLDPSLIKANGEEELSFEDELAKHKQEIETEAEQVPQEEAIPKGAEILNINDIVGGMKIAKTLLFNDVVYGDKGQLLTEDRIKQLNRMGVSEVCVYIDAALKKKAQQKREQLIKSASIKTDDAGAVAGVGQQPNKQVFAKVKRSAVRIEVEEPAEVSYQTEEGEHITEDSLVVDVSAGGCGLLTKDKMAKGVEINLTFKIDDGKFAMENVKGIVRHSMIKNGTDEYPYRNGVFFTSLTDRFRENMISVLFRVERALKQEEDKRRARMGYAPKKYRPR